jgi:RNase P/RNase MRP subunit POP5
VKIDPYPPDILYAWATGEKVGKNEESSARSKICPNPYSFYDAKELYRTVFAAITDWYGDREASCIGIAVAAIFGPFALLRVRRGTERKVSAILPFIRDYMGNSIRLASLQTSGTILKLKKSIIRKQTYLRTQKPILYTVGNTNKNPYEETYSSVYTAHEIPHSMWCHASYALDDTGVFDHHNTRDKKENGFNHICLQYLTKDDI